MKLTKGRKQKILERFADGESIAVIADWYERSPKQIEDVIREGMGELIIENGELKIIGAETPSSPTLVDP